jgi:hypothetical protein
LQAGEHFFRRAGSPISLRAEPGKTYYVVISAGGLASGGVKFVSPDEGEKLMKKLPINPDRWLLRQYLANWSSVRVGMSLAEVTSLISPEGSFLGYGLTFKNGVLVEKHDAALGQARYGICTGPYWR